MDAFCRKWGHALFHWGFECSLACDAFADDASHFLEALENPRALAQLGQSLLGAAMNVLGVDEADKGPNVRVLPWQDDGEFCTIVEG